MLALAAGLASYPDEAHDISQDAVLNAYKALPQFRADAQFSTWLYRIFVNTALNYKRKLSHKLSRQLPPSNDQVEHEHYHSNPQQQVENTQLNLAIERALGVLSEKERIAFVLCHQQELAINEAAQIMACTEGSVKSYLFRARDKLRRTLQEYKNT